MLEGVTEPTVVDNPDMGRFELEVDGHLAELVYDLRGERLVLIHTEVPEALGGRGLGGVLVQAAVDRAEAEELVIVPQCPFARAWLEKHPDQAARVAVDW
jgi:predicted GNAT family acetyltransferase